MVEKAADRWAVGIFFRSWRSSEGYLPLNFVVVFSLIYVFTPEAERTQKL
jgi:hypothetical protein